MTSTNRFIAPIINVTSIPAPEALEALDTEALLEERMADFVARAVDEGVDYDVGTLEVDPIKIVQTTGARREMLLRERVNQGIRAVLPAYAQGADLENIAARANVSRLTLIPANEAAGVAAVMESDASLLIRYLASFSVPSAGSSDAYIYHALTSYPEARDVAVLGPSVHARPGEIEVVLLSEGGVATSNDTVASVLAYLKDGGRAPLTDVISVKPAAIIPYAISLHLTLPRGPDPAAVVAQAAAAVRAVADARYAIGMKVWTNLLAGAAYVANVLRVQQSSPSGDIQPGPDQAAYCTAVNITYEVDL